MALTLPEDVAMILATGGALVFGYLAWLALRARRMFLKGELVGKEDAPATLRMPIGTAIFLCICMLSTLVILLVTRAQR